MSAYAFDRHGLAAAFAKMAFGNKMGVKVDPSLSKETLFETGFGEILAEVKADSLDQLQADYEVVGTVTEEPVLVYGEVKIALDEAEEAWKKTLENVFATKSEASEEKEVETKLFRTDKVHICSHKIGQPTVFIPVFPGTNCEYDSAKAFERAGAKVITKVFKNLDAADIRDSVAEFEAAIAKAQIMMFPGGFSAGDEPDGSAKFFATAFQNAKIKEAVEKLLE